MADNYDEADELLERLVATNYKLINSNANFVPRSTAYQTRGRMEFEGLVKRIRRYYTTNAAVVLCGEKPYGLGVLHYTATPRTKKIYRGIEYV